MIILISPSKTLDFQTDCPTQHATVPRFLDSASQLIDKLKTYSPQKLQQLMSISEKLADLNADRFQSWNAAHSEDNSRPAVFSFRGDVYDGLQPELWSKSQLRSASQQLRILSGLYGILQPMDLIQPYRLEMGTKLKLGRSQTLYDFWGTRLTSAISDAVAASGSRYVLNLASKEYSSVLDFSQLPVPVITPSFQDERKGRYRVLSFFAKKARGEMASWVICNRVKTLRRLKEYAEDGYALCNNASNDFDLTFRRPEAAMQTT